MSGRRYIALGIVLALVVVGYFAWKNVPDDDVERATVGEALQSFREGDGDGSGVAGGPPLGVYRYRASGSESIQTSLLGSTHDYDGISTLTLSEGKCGLLERWQPLVTRWSEIETCPAKRGSEFVGVIEFHEFFGIQEELVYECEGVSMSDPPVRRPGARFASRCTTDDSTLQSTGRVIGFEKVKVGGEAYDALHTRAHSVSEGYVSGEATRNEWVRRSDGLMLRRTFEADVEIDKAGGTDAVERYEIELVSTEPER